MGLRWKLHLTLLFLVMASKRLQSCLEARSIFSWLLPTPRQCSGFAKISGKTEPMPYDQLAALA